MVRAHGLVDTHQLLSEVQLNETVLMGPETRCMTRRDTKLAIDRLKVMVDCACADSETVGYLAVGKSLGDALEYLDFTRT